MEGGSSSRVEMMAWKEEVVWKKVWETLNRTRFSDDAVAWQESHEDLQEELEYMTPPQSPREGGLEEKSLRVFEQLTAEGFTISGATGVLPSARVLTLGEGLLSSVNISELRDASIVLPAGLRLVDEHHRGTDTST